MSSQDGSRFAAGEQGSRLVFSSAQLTQLYADPRSVVTGQVDGVSYQARVIIADYDQKIAAHFRDIVGNDLQDYCRRVDIPLEYRHYGVAIEFSAPIALMLHDERMALDLALHTLMSRLGPVIIRNGYLVVGHRDQGHRNRFPHLNFHVDRSRNQQTYVSLFTRNPFDSEQVAPRTSSTLFIANIVGYLQAQRQGLCAPDERGLRTHYDNLFGAEDVRALFGDIILEHAWDAPHGTGEISMQDNRTMLHASYYPQPALPGYRIGVRYLS